ncbi:MAG: hypothetical protein PVJ53_17975, partial [Desulfobacterales bacterium]
MLPAVLFVALLLLVGHILMPLVAEYFILPRGFEALGIRDYELPVRRLDLFGMDLGTLRIGPQTAPGIAVVSLSADYHPGGLLQRRLTRVTLAGVRILVRAKPEGGFEIPGLPEMKAGNGDGRSAPPQALPFAVAEIQVEQGEVILQQGEKRLRLPFEASIRPDPDMSVWEGVIRLALPDRWTTVNARVDLAANRLWADWEGDGIRPEALGMPEVLAGRLTMTGNAHARGRVQGRLTPFEVETLDMTVGLSPCRLNWDAIRLDLSGATPHGDMQMTITHQAAGHWKVQSSPIRVATPRGEGRFTLAGAVAYGDRGLSWAGSLASLLTLDPARDGLPELTLPLNLETSARFSPDGRW